MNSRLQNSPAKHHKPMKVKALKSFIGIVSMSEGEVREISDLNLVSDLIGAGLVEDTEKKTEEKPKTRKRSAKK